MTLAGGKKSSEQKKWEDEEIVVSALAGEDVIVELKLNPEDSRDPQHFSLFCGDQLMPSERYSVQPRGNVVQLTLKQSQKDDTGHYSLVAKKLTTNYSALSDSNDISVQGVRKKIRMNIREASDDPEEGEPPIFVRRLTDLAVKVGTRTRFLVEIRSSSSPKVTWHRNDQQIQAGSRFSFVHEGNFYCVDVAPVMVEDQGHWTCMVENVYGRSSCVSCLSVIVPKAYKRPEFVEELRAILTETGTVSLECKVIGVPTPVLRWFKDSKEIKAGDVFALTANADDPTSLGTYTCQADNCMGTAYSSSKVHVVGRGSREGSLKPADTLKPSGPLPVFRKILNDECCRIGDTITLTCQVQVPPWPKVITWYNKEGKVEPSEKYHEIEDGLGTYSIEIRGVEAMDEGEWKCVATSAENVMQFTTCYVAMSVPKNYRMPRFMESLKAVLTEEGLVSFECKVVGFPTPFLRWFKDGQELKPGDVYQLTGTNSLGSYCCIARNCMGEAKSTAELTVEDIQNQLNEEERLQLLSFNQVPKFIKGLRSCEARIHENFTFTVQVTVSPKPTLSWFRDDELITESDKYKIIQEVLGTCHLEIHKLEFSDQAEWKCIAENDFGHSITSCFLKLIIPRHFKKPKFLESLRAILSEEGAVNLECKVIGVPQPVLKWYKDGAELKPGDIHRIISGQDGTCCLGTYTCEATNCMGSVSSSASLLGFEDRVAVKKEETQEPISPPLHELARNLSLSTIHEERTSQLYDTPQTDHSITMDDRGEISFSFDGKEVSVSLYETPDLTEEEAIQIVEMYADQLSEHITEGNIIELPPMRFMKETSTSGNLLMEAVIIDVSSDYFVADEEADDLRTEADVEDVSIMDDQMHSILSSYSSPLVEHSGERTPVGERTPPSRPPRKKERSGSASSKSEKSEKSQHKVLDWSESYHSAKEPSMQAQLSLQSQDSVDAFADALSSDGLAKVSREYDREIAAIINETESGIHDPGFTEEVFAAALNESLQEKKKKKKRSKAGTPMLSSKTSSEDSYTVNADGNEVGKGKRRGNKDGKKRDRKDSAGSNSSVKERGKKARSQDVEKSLMIEDIRVERSEEFKTPDLFSQAEIKYIDEDDKFSTASSAFATAGDVSDKSTSRSQKERLYERLRCLTVPVLTLRDTLIDLEGILMTSVSDDENLIQGLIIEKIVRPIEDLCEQMSVIESKAVKSAGDRSFSQGVRISLLDSIGGPTEELLRGIELIKRHRGRNSEDLKSDLIVLESLTDPVDEILAGLAKIEHDLRSKEGDVTTIEPKRPIVLERTSRAIYQLESHVDRLRKNPKLNSSPEIVTVTERLEAVYKNLSSFISSLSLNKVTGALESNVDVLVVETLVKPLEGLSRALNELLTFQVVESQVIKTDTLQKSIAELKNKLETLTVALETYEAESGERGVTEGSRELVGYLKWTMEDASDKLVKLQRINEAKLLDDLASVPTSSDEEGKDQNKITFKATEIDKEVHKSLQDNGALEEEIKILEEKIFERSIDEEIESQFKEEITENLEIVAKQAKAKAKESHASKRAKYRNRMVSIDSMMPELDESLPLPEMLLDPLIDVQAKLNVALRHYENEAPSDQTSLSMTELSGCLIELRESVASAVHVATTFNVPDVINSIVELREPLLDLQLALASGTSAQESTLIEESARPLNELNEIISAVIRSSSTSEASQVILNQVSRMMSEILEQLPEIPDKKEEITMPVVKMVPIAPSVEVEQAALALGSVHYALSSAIEKAGRYSLAMEDTDGKNKTTAGKLVSSIDVLRQSIGNLAVAISSPMVPEEKAFEYNISLAVEELGKLQEPLLNLQKVLLIEKHDPEERHVLNDITSPLKALKEAMLKITKEKRASVVDLLEDVEKDVALVAMEALKKALVGKVDTEESSVSDSAPGEVPGIISKCLDPIENWLSTALENTNDEESNSSIVPVIDELKKCLLKIVIQSSYSEPPSDTELIEKFAELKEPLMKVRETIAEHHDPDDVQVLENLVQPTQHLLQTILETSTMYKATSLLQPVIEVLEELENQISLSIKMAEYAKELKGVVSTIKADEFDEAVEKMESCSLTVRAEAHEVDVTEVEDMSREDYMEEISDQRDYKVADEEEIVDEGLEMFEDDKQKVGEEEMQLDDLQVNLSEEKNEEAFKSLVEATSLVKDEEILKQKIQKSSTLLRSEELDLWTLTILNPLDRLASSTLALDRSIDEKVHELLCRPLDSLHKQIELVESQINRPAGQSLENDVETIIEGFLSPLNQVETALKIAATEIWHEIPLQETVKKYLQDLAESSSDLCKQLDSLRRKLIAEAPEQIVQVQKTEASLIETISAVIVPLEGIQEFIVKMLADNLAKEQIVFQSKIQDQDNFSDTNETVSKKDITEISAELDQDDKSDGDIKHIEKTTARPLEELIEAIVDPASVRHSTTPDEIEEIDVIGAGDEIEKNKEEIFKFKGQSSEQYREVVGNVESHNVRATESKEEMYQEEMKELTVQSCQEVQESVPEEISSDIVQDLQGHKLQVTEVETLEEVILQQASETLLTPVMDSGDSKEDINGFSVPEVLEQTGRTKEDDVIAGEEMVESHFVESQENRETASEITLKEEIEVVKEEIEVVKEEIEIVKEEIEIVKEEISNEELLNKIEGIVKSELDRQNALVLESEELINNVKVAVEEMMIKYPQICQVNVFEESVRDVVVEELQKMKGFKEIENTAVESDEFTEEKIKEIIYNEISKEKVTLVKKELLEVVKAKVQQVLQAPKAAQMSSIEESIREIVTEELHKFEAKEKTSDDLIESKEVIVKEEMSQQAADVVAVDITDEKVDELVMKELQKQRVELSGNDKLVDLVKTKLQELVVILPEIREEIILEEKIRNIVAEEMKKVDLGIEGVQDNLVKAETSGAVSRTEEIIQPIVGENFEEKVKDMIVDEFKRQEFYPIEDPLVKEIKIKVQEIVLLSSCSADDGIKEEILRDIVFAEVEKYVVVLKDVEDLCEAKQSQETAVKAGIDKKDDIKEEIKDLTGIGKEEQAKTDIQKETEDIKQKQGVLESILVSEDMIREELKKQDLYPVEDPLVKEIKAKIEEEIVLSPFVPEEMVKELISAEVNKHVADLKEIEGLDKAKEMSVASQVDKKEEISLNKAKIEESEDVKDVKREEIKSLGISDDMIREELKKQDLYPVEDPLVKEIKAKVQEEILLSSHTTEENIPEEMIRDLILVEVEKYVGQIKEIEKFGNAQENLRKDQEASLREEIESKEEAGIRAEEDEDKNTKKESDVLKGLIVSEDMIRNELKKQQLYPVEDPLVKDIKTKVEEVILMSSHTLEENIPDEIIRDLILVEIEKHVAELKYDDCINEVETKESISLLQKESISKEEIKDLKEKVEESVQGDKTASQKQIVEPKDILMEAQVLEQRENTAIASQYTISEDKIHELVVSELDKQNAKSLVDDELKNKITLKIQQLIINRPEVVKEDTIESSVGEIVQEEIQKQAKLVEIQKLDSAKSLEVSTEEEKIISEDVVRDIIVAHLKKQNLNTSEEADVLNTVEEKAGNLMSECPEMCTVDAIEVTVEEIVRKTLTERATSQKLEVLIVPSETHEEVPEETIHEMVIDEVHRNNIEPTEEYRIIERIEAKIQQLILLHPKISGLNFLSEKVHDFVEEIVEEDKAEVVEIENLLRAEEDKREIEVLEMPLVPEIEEIVEEEIDEQTIKFEAKADVHDLESKKSEQQVITLDKEVCEVQKDKEVIKDAAVEEENKNSRREERKEAEEIIEVSKDKVQEETRKIEETEDKYGGKIAADISEKKIEEEMKEVSDNDKFAKEESKNESIEVVKQTEVEEMSKEKVIESEDKIKEAKEANKVSEEMDLKKKEEIKIGDQKKEKVQILRVPSETHAHVSEEMVHEIVVGEIHKLNIEPSKEDNLIKAVEFKVQDLIAQFPELSKEEIIEENVKHIVAEQLQEEKAKASEFDETMDKAQVQTKVEVLQTPATTQIQVPEEMVHDLIIEELQKQDVQMSEENNLVKAIESKVNDLIAQHPEISREEIIEESVREIVTEKLQEHKADVLETEKLERAQADELKKKVEVLNVPALAQVEVPEENVHDIIIEGFNKQNIEPLTHENLVKAVEAKIKDLIAQHPDIRKSDVLEENVRDIITEVWAEERASVVEQEKLAEAKEEIVNKTKVEVFRMPDKQDETAQIIEEIDRGVGVKDALKVKRKSSDKGEKDEKKSPKDELEKSGSQDGEENKRASVKSKSRKSEDKGVEDKNRDSIKGRKKSDDKNKDEEIRRTSLEDKKKEIEEKTRDSLKKKYSEELGDKNKGEKRRTSLKEKAEDNGEDVDKKRRESLKKSEKIGNEEIEGKTRKEAEKKKEIEEKTRDSLKKKHSEELGDKNKEEKRRTSLKDKDKDVEEKTRDSLKKKKQSEESDDKSKDVEEKRRASLKEKPENKKKDIEEKQDSLKIIEDKDVEEKTRSSLKKKSVKSEDKDKNEEEEKRRISLKEKEEKSKDKDKFEEEKRRTSLKEKVEDNSKDSEKKRRESLKKSEKSDDKGKNVEEKRRKSLKEKDESNVKDADKRRTSLKKKSEKSVDYDKGVEERRPSLKMRSEEKEDIKVKQLDSQKTDKESKIIDAPKEEKERLKEDSIVQLDKSVVKTTDEKSRDTKEEYRRVTEDNQVAAKQPDSKLLKANIDSELDSEFSESSVSTLKNVSTKERYKRSNPPMIEIDYDESSPRETSRRSNLSRKYRDLESIDLDDKSLGVYSTDTSWTAGVSHGPRDRGKKPSFCTKLTDRTAAESSRIKLTCAVLGEPEPAVYWLKDGKLLSPSSNRHGTTLENGMASLELYTVRPSDTGEYSCIARNPHGQACTEAKLKVYAGYEPTPTTPTFTRTIKDTYLRGENTLVLECRVRGQPTPAITWLKDGQVLEISERYQQCDLPDGLCRLKIFNPDFYDSGLYTCRAENDTKLSDRTSHLVDFEATGRAAQNSRSWRGSSYNDITSTEKDTGRPRFSSYLTDHSVPVGGTIALQVEVKGVPPPDVTWMRADKKGSIAVPKARTFADSGVYTLIVPDATEYETGTYVCRASNSYGHVDTTATIEVVSGSLGDGGKPAIFVSRPPDKVIIVAVGEDVSVSFRTNGIPKPKVIWMKGLRDITSGPRSYKEGHDDYVRLTLKRACPSDEGTYCILVKNRYGCDRSFFSVQVKQRARSLTPSPDWGSVDTDSLLANIHDKERSYLKQVPGPISTEPVVIDGGRNWLALTWGKAEQRGSAPVVAYRVDGWLLGGEGGARWVELGVTPINAFDAFNLRPGEEYKFRITPRNRYGWGEPVTMTNSVTVREVVKFPEFTKILPGQLKALEGTVLNLDCEVSSDSLAHVKWYRDTTEIENGHDSRFTTYFNGTKCTLMIGNISENDSGRYVCEATNAAGRVSTFARVQVVEDPKIVEADLKLRKMRSSDVANEERPPEFTMRLRDRRVQATYPVRLTCQVTGYPEPEVTWYKYREELCSQENVSIWNDEAHFHTLEINRSTIDDSGIYMARAKNIYGSVSCRCHLTVDKGIRAYIAPEFLRHLDSIYTVKAGGELRMTAQIEAYPTVGVTWHRDGHRLRPSRDVVMTLNHDGSVELDLAHVTPRDAGLYCCTATNEVGQTETTTRVTVLDNDDIKSVNQSVADESLAIPYSKEPVFVTKPLSTEAFEGDTVIISCEVVGDPKPEVIWLRDFLRPDYYKDAPHFRRVGAGPQYRLEIPYAKLDFTGTYSIIAKNCHGEAKAVISLQIYARGQGKEDSGMESTIKHGNVQTLPVIKRPLRDLRCCDGDAITLVCKLHAKPEPDIRWEKGGKLLPLGGDFASDFDGETARLSIQHVYPEDEGEYTCVAYNELGKAYTSACVIVDVPEGKETALSRRLIKPPGFLSANSTPISTPRSTPVRSLSPSCCKREVKPVTKTTCGYTGGRRPRMPTSPKFYAVPHNKVAEEGETVRFQCAIAGHPVPWVTWDKDGISITPTARISLKESDDVRILEIIEITHEDAGLYRVTLENDVGRTEATARLEIIKGRRSSISRPIRTRSASPRTYSIYGGRNPSPTPRSDSRLQPPRISDTYSGGRGTSPTLPRWHYRNGNAVNDEKINAKTSSMELNKPRSSSVPRHCKMEREKSNFKQVSESPIKNRKTRPSQHVTAPTQSSARKTSIPVRRKSSIKLNSNKQDKIDSKDKEKNYNSKDKNLKKKIKEEFKSPVILTVPADIIALRGAKVMLLTTYDGYPRPTVRWLRKGRDVTLDDKTEIETSAGLTCLTLLNVTTEEAGKYEVFIENKLGKDSRHVNVTVEGPPEPPAGSPAIQIIKDSRGVTLSWRSPVYDGGCAVTGYSVEMRRGEESCWVAVAEAKHSLSHTISGLDPEESYQFRVRAENIHGLSEPGMESETVIITKSETRKITTNISGFSLDPDEDTEDEIEPAYEPCVVALESGFLFDERYNVLEELGKGKYGVVRRIVDKSNGSSFAAKFVRTIKAKDRQQVNDEINIMNMLRHPKLLRLIAAFESPREMIMVTEYISGGELFERVVADDFTLTEKDSILFVRQICMGVDYMHDNLVVHLDLKPENIMCHTRTSHRIKLIDFGLAQTLKPDTPIRVLFGTPEFIPPEIIGFEPIGTESDMWSVGVICYVLLTGLSPFMGENDAETFANITRADFDFDDKAFSAISEEAKDFISGLLIKRKESRMSAKECLKHPWLAQRAESMSRVALPTDKLKKFIVRRKWQKTGNAIRALGRMAILSANSRKNSESLSDVSKEVITPTNEDIIITEDSLDDPIKINNINTDNLEFSNGRISKADSDELQITELSSDEYVDSHDIDTCDSSTIIETQRSISPEDFTKIEDKINVNKISTSDSLPSERFDIDDDLKKIMSDEADNKTDTFISELNSSEENIYTVDISMESLKTTSEIHEEFSENYCSITSLHINEPSFEVKEEITISRISLQDKNDNKFVNLIGEQNLKSNSSIVNKNDNNDDKIPARRPNFIPIESNTNSHGSVCKHWCKTNSSSLDNEEEISRVRGHSPLHRVVRTGSVSRTAKMFEQEQVSSSARQQLSPGSRIVLPAANARPQNERIRKAFAFWNK